MPSGVTARTPDDPTGRATSGLEYRVTSSDTTSPGGLTPSVPAQPDDSGPALALEHLRARVQQLVPSVTGMSVTVVDGTEPYTAAVSDERTAALDAVQYAEGGPAVTSATQERDVEVADTLHDAETAAWVGFAAAATARDVRSTLSVTAPAPDGTGVTVTFLASEPQAFAGLQDDIRGIVDLLAPDTFTDARPPLGPPARAGSTGSSRDQDIVDQAVGVVAATAGVPLEEAHRLLPDAASRASVDVAAAARAVLGED
jgi:hypothetical protein